MQPYQAWIEDVRRRYAPHFVPALRPASWMLYDRSGVQIARSPVGASLGKSWWHRDYFHGLGHDLDPRAPGATPLPPARAPHRSAVFESRATRTLMVAFSVPVWPGRPGEGDPVGLLAMTGELGHFAAFEAARNQFAVLVDLRPGEDGERGLVVEHPALDRELQVRPSRKGFHMDAEFVARAERLGEQRAEEFRQAAAGKDVPRGPPAVYEGGYHDPVLGEAGGEWLATLEPVIVKARGPAAAADTGWVVVVQQRAADALRPVESLRRDLLAGGLVALALVAAVITALWGFVIIVLNAAPESRLTGFLRRRLGLPSSASPGSSAASASQRTPGGSGPTPGERDA